MRAALACSSMSTGGASRIFLSGGGAPLPSATVHAIKRFVDGATAHRGKSGHRPHLAVLPVDGVHLAWRAGGDPLRSACTRPGAWWRRGRRSFRPPFSLGALIATHGHSSRPWWYIKTPRFARRERGRQILFASSACGGWDVSTSLADAYKSDASIRRCASTNSFDRATCQNGAAASRIANYRRFAIDHRRD